MGDYDSRPETLAHIDRVQELLPAVTGGLGGQNDGRIGDA